MAVASLAIHLGAAWALGWIHVPARAATPAQTFVEFSIPAEAPAALPEPAPAPEPEPLAQPVAPVVRERHVEETHEVVEAEPEPVAAPAALPPSLEDVFGEEPAAAAPTLVAEGAGTEGFAVDPGQAGGTPGGHGTGTAAGGTSSAHEVVAAGPSQADVRRARRAYVRSLEGLLGGRVQYPRAAQRDHLEGRVEVCLRVGESGEILGRRICGSAGAAVLDAAALSAANELSRVPAPPALAAWSPSDEIHAGIAFVLR